MRGFTTDRRARIVIGGHAFAQHLRRVHDALGVDTKPVFREATAFDEHQLVLRQNPTPPTIQHELRSRNATVP
jgi:hypothetical protein